MQKVFIYFFSTLMRLCSFANKLGASNVWINVFTVQLYKHVCLAEKLSAARWAGESKNCVHLDGITSNSHQTHSTKNSHHYFILTYIFLSVVLLLLLLLLFN